MEKRKKCSHYKNNKHFETTDISFNHPTTNNSMWYSINTCNFYLLIDKRNN